MSEITEHVISISRTALLRSGGTANVEIVVLTEAPFELCSNCEFRHWGSPICDVIERNLLVSNFKDIGESLYAETVYSAGMSCTTLDVPEGSVAGWKLRSVDPTRDTSWEEAFDRGEI